jgi:DNA-binding NarL/FixJ family response regulator
MVTQLSVLLGVFCMCPETDFAISSLLRTCSTILITLMLTKITKWKARVLLVNTSHVMSDTIDSSLYELGNYKVVGIYRDLLNASLSLLKSKPEIMVISVANDADEFFLEKLKKIRNANLSLKIMLITDRADANFIFEAISIGICGILPANAQWPDVVNQLERIDLGLASLTPKVARVILDSFRLNLIPDLSKRQVEILKLMFLGMTYVTISDKLAISRETTKTHIKNIYRKLNVNSKEEALSKAIDERIIVFNI